MVGPKKQGFCPKINMLKGNFDTNYSEPLMILSSWQKSEFLTIFQTDLKDSTFFEQYVFYFEKLSEVKFVILVIF